jgi:hypothetical protein
MFPNVWKIPGHLAPKFAPYIREEQKFVLSYTDLMLGHAVA